MRKDILINTGLLLSTLLVFFGGIELGLRITGIQTVKPNPPNIYQQNENPRIRYELRPNIQEHAYRSTVTTDEYGFRIHNAIDNNTRPTIAVLGDSITFGYGVEDHQTLPAVLETLLPSLRFLNAGVPGYTLTQEIARFHEKRERMHPAGVMIVFFWNDLDGNPPGILDDQGILRPHNWTPKEEQCQPIEKGLMGFIPGKCWLDIHSAFYKAMKKVVNMIDGNRQLQDTREAAQEGEIHDPVQQEHLDAYIQELQEFSTSLSFSQTPECCQEAGSKIFVIWPDRYLHEESKPQLLDAAKSAGFTVIDLYELFGNEVPILGWDTVHPSAEAIAKAAEFIADRMKHTE